MAPNNVQRVTASTGAAVANSLLITYSSPPVDGNLIVIACNTTDITGTASISTPAGWTVLKTLANTDVVSAYYFYKIASGEGSSITLTVVGVGGRSAVAVFEEWSGASTISPFAISQMTGFASAATWNQAVLTPYAASSIVCSFFAGACSSNASTAVGANFTEISNTSTSVGLNDATLEYQQWAQTANSTATPSITWTTAAAGIGFAVVIQPVNTLPQLANPYSFSNAVSVSTRTIAASAPVTAGNWMIIAIATASSPTSISVGAGTWALTSNSGVNVSSNTWLYCAYHQVTAGESGTTPTYTVTLGASVTEIVVEMVEVANLDSTTPIAANPTSSHATASTTTLASASATPTTLNNLAIWFVTTNASTNLQNAAITAGWSTDFNNRTSLQTIQSCRLDNLTADTVTAQQATFTFSALIISSVSILLLLQPQQMAPMATGGGGPFRRRFWRLRP